jgi:hypothetical protein
MEIVGLNNRLGTNENLPLGATYDLLMIKFPDGFPEGQLTFNIDYTPRSITGIQKVAQYFLKTLLTTRGSDVIRPNYGTTFTNLVMQSNVDTTDRLLVSDLRDQVRSAESQTKAALYNDEDPSSRLKEILILGMDTSKESATMYLKMATVSGETAQVALPFPTTNIKTTPSV